MTHVHHVDALQTEYETISSELSKPIVPHNTMNNTAWARTYGMED